MRLVPTLVILALALFGAPKGSIAQETPQRPLVFVPGILGSRLCDADDKIIWGTSSSFSHFAQLELDGATPVPALHACGLVDVIQILGSLWTHNTYKSWLKGLSEIGFSQERKNLFIFAYDWRLSNFENAKRLDVFVRKNIGNGKQFDIVAHSMGGIVSKIYLDEYASAKSLHQIIYLGTPFLRSMNTFGTIKEGWGWPFTTMAGGQDVITRVVLSFPGMLELLPRYEDCCYVRKTDNSRQSLDIFDPNLWRSLHWLPASYSDAAKFARFSAALRRSKSLTAVLSQPAPVGVYEIIFASDIYDTLRLVGMKDGATTPQDWVFTSSKGDGTVPVWSVARNTKFDGYSNTLPSFAKHEHLFDDKWVENTLFRNIKSGRPDEPFQIDGPGRPVLLVQFNGASTAWPVTIAKVELTKILFARGEVATAEVTIELADTAANVSPGLYRPAAFVTKSGESYPLDVQELTNANDVRVKRLRFSAAAPVGNDEGVGVIVFHIDNTFEPSQAFYVLPSLN